MATNDEGNEQRVAKILMASTILVDGRFAENDSYRAEALGLLTVLLMAYYLHLYTNQQQRLSIKIISDNIGLVKCIKRYAAVDRTHVTPDIKDADIILPILYYTTKMDVQITWQRGHAENRKEREKWTHQEHANDIADEMAGRAWTEDFHHLIPNTQAPHYKHSTPFQVSLPDGSSGGQLSSTVPTAIAIHKGQRTMQQHLHLSDIRWGLIDGDITKSVSAHFGTGLGQRAHCCKQYAHQWFTEVKAHKHNTQISAKCRCCDRDEDETILHIFQCADREEVHETHKKKLTEVMTKYQIPNRLLHLIEAGRDLVLQNTDTHSGEQWDGDDDGTETENRIATLLLDTHTPEVYKRAFKQQTLLGWELLFTGKMATGWRDCHTDQAFWRQATAKVFADWGRACWAQRNITLYGERENNKQAKRQQLLQVAKVWMDAPRIESLIPISRERWRRRLLKRTPTGDITNWLNECKEQRNKARRGQSTNIMTSMLSQEELDNADAAFKLKLAIAQRARYRRTRTGGTASDPDERNEEPPD